MDFSISNANLFILGSLKGQTEVMMVPVCAYNKNPTALGCSELTGSYFDL